MSEHDGLSRLPPEILHEVFLKLPQQDLLLIQRVCKTWQSTIQSSKVLLAELFLCPEPKAYPKDSPVRINPLLKSRFPAFFETKHPYWNCMLEDIDRDYAASTGKYGHCMGPWYSTHWAQNVRPWPPDPDIMWPNSDWDWVWEDENERMCAEAYAAEQQEEWEELVADKRTLDPIRTAAYRYPEASWRKMLPCLPAPTRLQLSYETSNPESSPEGITNILGTAEFSNKLNESGWLTFGVLYDVITDVLFDKILGHATEIEVDTTYENWVYPQPSGPFAGMTVDEIKQFIWRQPAPPPTSVKMKTKLSQTMVGGPGCVTIFVFGVADPEAMDEFRFREEFTFTKGAVGSLSWEEIVTEFA